MTKQEEIREGVYKQIRSDVVGHSRTSYLAEGIINYLHSQGVVIKVDRELPDNEVWHKVEREFEAYCAGRNDMLKAGYVAVEPLIKEEK